MTAARASFGGIGWVYQHDFSSSVCSFGDKSVAQVAPTLIQKALTEVSIADHIRDLQGFQGHQVVGLGVVVRHFVEQVLTLVLDVFVQTLDALERLMTVLAALLGPLQGTLGKAQITLNLTVVFRRLDPLTLTVGE